MNLSALSGLQAGALLLSATADNVANLDTPGHHSERVDLATAASGGVQASVSLAPGAGVDLVEQVGNLIQGELLYKANAVVLRAGAETDKSLFDALA